MIHTHREGKGGGHGGARGGRSLADLGSAESLEMLKRHQLPVLGELKQVVQQKDQDMARDLECVEKVVRRIESCWCMHQP